jgi:hypothetical protein
MRDRFAGSAATQNGKDSLPVGNRQLELEAETGNRNRRLDWTAENWKVQ